VEEKKEKSFFEKMAEDFEELATALKQIPRTGFARKMLVLYLQDKTKLGKQKIETILDAIDDFLKEYEQEKTS